MSAFVSSTITLTMELVIGGIILFIIFQGWRRNYFYKKLAFFAIGYEIFFNVGYMIYRVAAAPSIVNLEKITKTVGMMHGILSLVLLLVVIAFLLRAGREYVKGINSFAKHNVQTTIFIISWMVSLLSGIYLYVQMYL